MNDNNHPLMLDWKALSQLQHKPKLSGLACAPRHLFEDYYQVSETEFLSASRQVNHLFEDEDIYINTFYWAASLGAFRRATSRKHAALEEDDGKMRALPDCLRLASDCTTYGSIKAFVERSLGRKTIDVPLSDENGVSLGACVSALGWGFYFRSAWSSVPDNETPYAVSLITNKRLLNPCD